jgi:hypothetical protein
MNETPTLQTPAPAPQKQNHTVAITAIIATAVVLLACIAGCTGVLIMLAQNAR